MHDTQKHSTTDAVPDSSGDQSKVSVAKFTPGPWRVLGQFSVFTAYATEGDDGVSRATSICDLRDGQIVETANLIAAAPDLYEALKRIENRDPFIPLQHRDGHGFGFTPNTCDLCALIAALAKAEGRL